MKNDPGSAAQLLQQERTEVLIIGAGPAGAYASSILHQQGIEVLVLEKQQFPRFSIGESLLPYLMNFLEKAHMLEAVEAAGFQMKNGAAFQKCGHYCEFNFQEKFSSGPATTFQVKRADFDKILADRSAEQGVRIRYRQEVLAIEDNDGVQVVTVLDQDGNHYQVEAGFILDASGYGRVLPRLLDLELPSDFPERQSVFCHIEDHIFDPAFDREKILISIHPENQGMWYWLIPFSDGTASLGVVSEPAFLARKGSTSEERLMTCIGEEPALAKLLEKSRVITPVQEITGYAANVSKLYSGNFALLGNAAEFLDPVFSSGVTIAFKSADIATSLLIRQKRGEQVDWETEFSDVLKEGVETFRAFVKAWYDGRLQDIIFYPKSSADIKHKICAILAGYVWDKSNPYVINTERRLNVLAEICRGDF